MLTGFYGGFWSFLGLLSNYNRTKELIAVAMEVDRKYWLRISVPNEKNIDGFITSLSRIRLSIRCQLDRADNTALSTQSAE